MIKKLFISLIFLLISFNAGATGKIANAEYVHSSIDSVWGIDVPYNSGIPNIQGAVNMKYLLETIDKANELAGTPTTYGSSLLAVDNAASKTA
ncbi:MAG TPA: hypothetical protein PLZ05_03545, partial [Alphaproteobacteria bacterium]|nr:hypothetical protein [Alphaproteobacteria bacterium]